jgi:hypothetical protein
MLCRNCSGGGCGHHAGDGNASLGQHMRHLRLAQARGIVFEGHMIFEFVDAKATKAVGVGELTETVELLKAQGRLQGVGDFKECHGEKSIQRVRAAVGSLEPRITWRREENKSKRQRLGSKDSQGMPWSSPLTSHRG